MLKGLPSAPPLRIASSVERQTSAGRPIRPAQTSRRPSLTGERDRLKLSEAAVTDFRPVDNR
jgi:hypothetical protein